MCVCVCAGNTTRVYRLGITPEAASMLAVLPPMPLLNGEEPMVYGELLALVQHAYIT